MARIRLPTKVHALVDARGLPARMALTAGQVHDSQVMPALLENLSAQSVLTADEVHNADWIRAMTEERDAATSIPITSNRTQRFRFSCSLHREQNRIERFFRHMK